MRKWLLLGYVVPLLPLFLLVVERDAPPQPPELARAEELSSRGDHEGAIRAFLAALETPAVQRFRGGVAQARYGLAQAHGGLGDYLSALRFAQEAEVLFRRTGLLREAAAAAADVGALQSTLGRHEEGRKTLLRALNVSRRLGDERRVAIALINLGNDDVRRGRTAQALETLLRAERLAAKIGDDLSRAHALGNIANTYWKAGDYPRGREHLLMSIDLFRKQNDVLGQAETLGLLAKGELKAGDARSALAHGQAAIALVDSERARIVTPELRAIMSGSFQPMYDTVIQAQLGFDVAGADERQLETAFRTSEMARGRILLDRLANVQTQIHGGDFGDSEEVERLRTQLRPRANALAADDAVLAKYRQSQARLRAAKAATMTAPPEVGFDAVRRVLLRQGGTLLEYWLGEDHTVVWVVDGRTARAFRLGARRTIERLAREYVAAIRDPANRDRSGAVADVEALGARLADAVFPAPVVAAVESGRILLVTHGALDLVPFAALPVVSPESGQRRLLVTDFEVTRLISAAAAMASSGTRRSGHPTRRVGVFADPQIAANQEVGQLAPSYLRGVTAGKLMSLGPIPFTGEEARAIASVVPADSVDLWLRADATRDRVLSSVADYQVVHFATHAAVSGDQPEMSGLVLSPGAPGAAAGYLGLADIYGLELDADLVVLSACETAWGIQIRGEGLISLTHGFLSAGAERVIASLWQVNDASTSDLMADLYTEMFHRGKSPASALRAAQLKQLRKPATRHPYFWAPFSIYGR